MEITIPQAVKMSINTWQSCNEVVAQYHAILKSYQKLESIAKTFVEIKHFLIGSSFKRQTCTLWDNGTIFINIYNEDIEKFIENLLGPLHRKYNIDWSLEEINSHYLVFKSSDNKIRADLNSFIGCITKVTEEKIISSTEKIYEIVCPE